MSLRDALFLHTQKTAGTSIIQMAREAYGSEKVVSHGDYASIGMDACARASFVSGHFGFAFAKSFMDDRYSFTFLRDPIDRVISLYDFCRSRPDDDYPIYAIAKRNSLHDFLLLAQSRGTDTDTQMYRETVWNHQTWQLALGWGQSLISNGRIWPDDLGEAQILDMAKANLDRFQFVGFTETFNMDAAHVLLALGIPSPATIPKLNASRGTQRSELPQETTQILRSLTELDAELYQYARSKRRAT